MITRKVCYLIIPAIARQIHLFEDDFFLKRQQWLVGVKRNKVTAMKSLKSAKMQSTIKNRDILRLLYFVFPSIRHHSAVSLETRFYRSSHYSLTIGTVYCLWNTLSNCSSVFHIYYQPTSYCFLNLHPN